MYACLIGNGLSIAFNHELSVARLTTWLGEAFRTEGGALEALGRFAQDAGTQADTFERLLGPLDRTARSLPHLENLLEVVQGFDRPDLRRGLADLADFAQRLHDLGLGLVLGRIAEQGAATEIPEFASTVLHVCNALKRLRGMPVTVATLNYDALLPAAFIRLEGGDPFGGQAPADMADLGDGRAQSSCEPIPGQQVETLELRAWADLPNRKIELLNLHGALSWLYDPETGRQHKVKSLGELREMDYWSELRDGRANCRPLVVLTDHKSEVISEAPFNVAYDAFQKRLIQADRWLIGGYGLGDVPVNAVLRDAASAKRRLAAGRSDAVVLPRVLVVDSECNAAETEQSVSSLLGVPLEQVTAEPAGFPEAVDGEAWEEWAM